jgi:hypothetical protein
MLIGGARAPGPTGGAGLGLGEAIRLAGLTVRGLGDDWLLEADVSRPTSD